MLSNIDINTKKSFRKSLSMSFDSQGVLQVKAPKFMLRSQINNFLQKNQAWIEKHYQEIKQRQEHKKYYLLGQEIENIDIEEQYFKQEAKKYIIPRCNELAAQHGFSHKGIRITSATTRWGSCSSKKTLNFSYRLIMSPPDCIDYVIIHELCHLRQMNHSAKFWKEVSDIMPEYKQQEQHLKKNGWKYRM